MNTIAIDFDGTIVEHEFPEIGEAVPGALETMHALLARGHRICLWTCRTGKWLDAAVAYCEANGIKLTGVNKNPNDAFDEPGPKMFAHTYIDDAALGVPLVHGKARRAYVDWPKVRDHLERQGWL